MTTPVFTWQPAYSHSHRRTVRSLVTTFENGIEQRAYLMTAPREWDCNFIGSPTLIKEIEAFWLARRGNVESFSWTPPSETTAITVRFKDEELKTECSGLHVWELTCTFREVL